MDICKTLSGFTHTHTPYDDFIYFIFLRFYLHVTLDRPCKVAIRAAQIALNTAQSDTLFNSRRLIMHTDQGSAYMASETLLEAVGQAEKLGPGLRNPW